jgi:hypothetical protein
MLQAVCTKEQEQDNANLCGFARAKEIHTEQAHGKEHTALATSQKERSDGALAPLYHYK